MKIPIGTYFFLFLLFLYSAKGAAQAQDSTLHPFDTGYTYVNRPIFYIEDWRTILDESVWDSDSNEYHLQQLGSQIWMVENLHTYHFNDGQEIYWAQDSADWVMADEPALCWDNYIFQSGGVDSLIIPEDQVYYNYRVVEAGDVCPTGFHIPTINDWLILESFLDSMNAAFNCHIYPISGDTVFLCDLDSLPWNRDINYSGVSFSSKPYGYRDGLDGMSKQNGSFGFWWSSSIQYAASAWGRILSDRYLGVDDAHLIDSLSENNSDRPFIPNDGLAIKCIRNEN